MFRFIVRGLAALMIIWGLSACQAGSAVDEAILRTQLAATVFAEQTGRPQPIASLTATKVVSPTIPPPSATPSPTPSPSPSPTPAPVSAGMPIPQPREAITSGNVKRINGLALWGPGKVYGVGYSLDGRLLAWATALGVYLYEGESLQLLNFIQTAGPARGVALSPDGNSLAFSPGDGSLTVVRTSNGEEVVSSGASYEPSGLQLSFSPDGSYLVGWAVNEWGQATEQGTIWVWRTSDWGLAQEIQEMNLQPSKVVFASDCESMLIITSSGQVYQWRLADAKLLNLFGEGGGGWTSAALSPDSSLIAVDTGLEVEIWGAYDASYQRSLSPEGFVRDLFFSPDGQTLAIAGGDWRANGEVGKLTLWRIQDGSLLRELSGHEDDVIQVIYSPDGEVIASASEDGTARLWWVKGTSLQKSLTLEHPHLARIAFLKDGQQLLTEGSDGIVRIWQVSDGALLHTLGDATTMGEIANVAFSSDGRLLAASSTDGSIRIWQVQDGSVLHTLQHSEEAYWGIEVGFTAAGDALVSVDINSIRFWQTGNGKPIRTLSLENADAYQFGLYPNKSAHLVYAEGELVIATNEDDILRMRRAKDMSGLPSLTCVVTSAKNLALSPDGSLIASLWGWEEAPCDQEGNNVVKMIKVSESRFLYDIDLSDLFSGGVMAFSPNGQFLAVGNQLYRTEDGALLHTLGGASSGLLSMSFSPDSTILASGMENGNIYLWQVADGALLSALQGHHGRVNSVAFSSDGMLLASGSQDGTIRLWAVR